MSTTAGSLTIGAFACAAGVTVETVRYYQRRGLVAEPERTVGTVRRYGVADVARVRFIKSAQGLGFSLDDIGELLALDDGTHCREARALGQCKLDDVRRKLAELRRIESVLARLVVGRALRHLARNHLLSIGRGPPWVTAVAA